MTAKSLTIQDLSITLIEPSPTQKKIISNHLESLGISRSQWFQEGSSCLESLKTSFKPDLIISAMYLPDMSGTELVQSLKNDPDLDSIPFMLISSEISDYYLEPIRQAGVVAILPKPFDLNELRNALYATVDFLEPDTDALEDFDIEDLHVLLVDDSLSARKHIVRVLNSLGIENITETINGKEAIDQLESDFFDLIVTDYNMPEMDGRELIDYVREQSNQSSIPVLMVTSDSENSHLAGIKQSGISAICDKPFEPKMVISLIKKILSSSSHVT